MKKSTNAFYHASHRAKVRIHATVQARVHLQAHVILMSKLSLNQEVRKQFILTARCRYHKYEVRDFAKVWFLSDLWY